MLDLDMIRKIYAMDFMPGAGFVSFSIDSYGECSVENPFAKPAAKRIHRGLMFLPT